MVEINGSLFIIKESAIYAVQQADQIDPELTNIALPNIIPRPVLSEGCDSELVGKTLLTAVTLFNKGKFLPHEFDHGKALSLSFEALTSMIAMRAGATEFEVAQQKAHEKALGTSSGGGSPHIPAMGDVTNPCRAFMQQAYHAQGSLLTIVELFYPDISKKQKKDRKGPWDRLAERVNSSEGTDIFIKFLGQAVPFLKDVQNIRDCLDHKNVKGVVVRDFTLQPDGKVVTPTIEVDFRGTRHPPVAISEFMSRVLNILMYTFEMMIVHLATQHYKPPAPFPIYIDMPAENRRFWKHVRFYYGSCWNGEFIPMG
jgi:hypothetical protein